MSFVGLNGGKTNIQLLCFLTEAEPPVWRCVGVYGVCSGVGGGVYGLYGFNGVFLARKVHVKMCVCMAFFRHCQILNQIFSIVCIICKKQYM